MLSETRSSSAPRPATQTSLSSHSVCVTACNVWAGCANSVEVYAHQITPLKRLRVGKESPAKRWCLEACCLLTCNASRASAGCGGPRFISYKGCCHLQHVPGTQVGVTLCSPVLVEMAPHPSPVGHQPKTQPVEVNTRAAAAHQETLPTTELIVYAGFPLKRIDYSSMQINTTVD